MANLKDNFLLCRMSIRVWGTHPMALSAFSEAGETRSI
jgi:hypothetical protein